MATAQLETILVSWHAWIRARERSGLRRISRDDLADAVRRARPATVEEWEQYKLRASQPAMLLVDELLRLVLYVRPAREGGRILLTCVHLGYRRQEVLN